MTISKASAQWVGDFKAGKGVMKAAHGVDTPFSVGSRFEGQAGSNPEEMLGAALAGCFSMALSLSLGMAGTPPKVIQTSANVKLEKDGDGFTVTTIDLRTEADVPGIDAAKFKDIAEATKKACPISKALAAVKTITLEAVLKST